ncbi:MAG: hypothetical protein ACJARZ_001623 [Dokdonia sp.]|jgi:hypothetical protein
MKLNFKHIDCGVRRGFHCKEQLSKASTQFPTQYNSTYILGKTVIILRIHRNQITTADEIQLFGERITKSNQKHLIFELPENEPFDSEVLQYINEDMRTMHPLLEAKSYLTIISKNYIDITLIGETE